LERKDSRCVIIPTELGERRTCLRRVKFALLDSSLLVLPSLLVGLLDSLLDLLAHNALKTSLDLSTAVLGQGTIGLGNIMPEEYNVENTRDYETKRSDNPNEQGEKHGEIDDSFLFVSLLNHRFDVEEELLKV
jgi:hypothetical protein